LKPEKKENNIKVLFPNTQSNIPLSGSSQPSSVCSSWERVWSVGWKDNDGKTEFLSEIDQTSYVLIKGHDGILTSQSNFTFPNLLVRDKCISFFYFESSHQLRTSALQTFAVTVKRSIDRSIDQSINQKISHF